jgi:hypothetical protein
MLKLLDPLLSSGSALAGIPTITDCVMAELEKLGPKYRMALKYVQLLLPVSPVAVAHVSIPFVCRIARDPRFERLPCSRSSVSLLAFIDMSGDVELTFFLILAVTDQGNYADDCLVHRVTISKCYIVATVRLSLPPPSMSYLPPWLLPSSKIPRSILSIASADILSHRCACVPVRSRSASANPKGSRCASYVHRQQTLSGRASTGWRCTSLPS